MIDFIYYINSKKRKDRKQFMENQLLNIDIPYSRFEAIVPTEKSISKDGEYYSFLTRNMFKEEHSLMGIEKIPPNYFRGTLGCYLSHYFLLKKIAKSNFNNTLVIEDDCNLNCGKSLIELKKAFTDKKIPNNWDIIRSTWSSQKNIRKINYCHPLSEKFKQSQIHSLLKSVHEKYSINKFQNPLMYSLYGGTHFQVINKHSCQKIINYLDSNVILPIDALYTTNFLNVYHAKFGVTYGGMGSDIQGE